MHDPVADRLQAIVIQAAAGAKPADHQAGGFGMISYPHRFLNAIAVPVSEPDRSGFADFFNDPADNSFFGGRNAAAHVVDLEFERGAPAIQRKNIHFITAFSP
jgi:hypothetical protein